MICHPERRAVLSRAKSNGLAVLAVVLVVGAIPAAAPVTTAPIRGPAPTRRLSRSSSRA